MRKDTERITEEEVARRIQWARMDITSRIAEEMAGRRGRRVALKWPPLESWGMFGSRPPIAPFVEPGPAKRIIARNEKRIAEEVLKRTEQIVDSQAEIFAEARWVVANYEQALKIVEAYRTMLEEPEVKSYEGDPPIEDELPCDEDS